MQISKKEIACKRTVNNKNREKAFKAVDIIYGKVYEEEKLIKFHKWIEVKN